MSIQKLMMICGIAGTLAACEMAQVDEQGRLLDISPAALAALPPGVDPLFLIRDSRGCYGIGIEQPMEGQPQSGPALLDARGQPICDALS